jgi:hypothetical protein
MGFLAALPAHFLVYFQSAKPPCTNAKANKKSKAPGICALVGLYASKIMHRRAVLAGRSQENFLYVVQCAMQNAEHFIWWGRGCRYRSPDTDPDTDPDGTADGTAMTAPMGLRYRPPMGVGVAGRPEGRVELNFNCNSNPAASRRKPVRCNCSCNCSCDTYPSRWLTWRVVEWGVWS